ncbi:MAG: hypothetical protein R3B90_14585 [Planctomycetaceae bacterium]
MKEEERKAAEAAAAEAAAAEAAQANNDLPVIRPGKAVLPGGQSEPGLASIRASAPESHALINPQPPAEDVPSNLFDGVQQIAHNIPSVQRDPSQVTAAQHRQSASPFGNPSLEFVPADTFDRVPEVSSNMPPASRGQQPAGVIQQAAGVEVEQERPEVAIIGDTTPFNPEAQAPPQIDWAEIDRLINAGRDVEAHRQLSSLYWEHPELRPKLKERIEQTSQRIYFQPQTHYLDPYVVQPGDVLQGIARSTASVGSILPS